ncbi:MAG: hypothetical protein ACRDZ2_00595, partial [Ilumatobacteraceae bacterium]
RGQREAASLLDCVHVVEKLGFGNRDFGVPEAGVESWECQRRLSRLLDIAGVDEIRDSLDLGLPGEAIDHSVDCVGLTRL